MPVIGGLILLPDSAWIHKKKRVSLIKYVSAELQAACGSLLLLLGSAAAGRLQHLLSGTEGSCTALIWSSLPVKVANSSDCACKRHRVLTVKMMALEPLTPAQCFFQQPETSVLFKVLYFISAFEHKLNTAEALPSPLASHTLSSLTYSPSRWYTCPLYFLHPIPQAQNS